MEELEVPWKVWAFSVLALWFALLHVNGWIMRQDLDFKLWVYNFYETDPSFVPLSPEAWVKVIFIALTGWAAFPLYLLHLGLKALKRRFGR